MKKGADKPRLKTIQMEPIESIEAHNPDYIQMATFKMETQVQYASDGEVNCIHFIIIIL